MRAENRGKTPMKRLPFIPATTTIALFLLVLAGAVVPGPQSTFYPVLSGEDRATLGELIDEGRCPCRCGRYLPGSSNRPACFGCSVGKAEITRMVEGLLADRELIDIVGEMNEPVLVSVFSDYDNPDLSEMWHRANRIAGEFNQHRVVLRVFGRTDDARRAVKLVEYARGTGRVTVLQELLIDHRGPWDDETLVGLAAQAGLDPDDVRKNYKRTQVADQMRKDRQHSRQDKVKSRPTVTVNRKIVADTDEALRKAIRDVVEDGSI